MKVPGSAGFEGLDLERCRIEQQGLANDLTTSRYDDVTIRLTSTTDGGGLMYDRCLSLQFCVPCLTAAIFRLASGQRLRGFWY